MRWVLIGVLCVLSYMLSSENEEIRDSRDDWKSLARERIIETDKVREDLLDMSIRLERCEGVQRE